MNFSELLSAGYYKLKKNRVPSPMLDSEILLSKVLNKTREEILTNEKFRVNKKNITEYNKLILRRCLNEPIAYILNEKEFWSKSFFITTDTLIPRPETELMVEKLKDIFKGKKISILDIGTGCGCILISLLTELNLSNGIGIDISKNALKVAEKNSQYYGVSLRAKFLKKSVIGRIDKKFDLIVSNPPYIKTKEIKNLSIDIKKYEPRLALDGGYDGLDLIKKVIYKTKEILKFKGLLAIEIGNEQYRIVSKLLLNNNFRIEHRIKDYKNVRCLIARYLRK